MKKYIKGLHHIGIPTSNMADTVKFYASFGAAVMFEKEDVCEGKPIRVVLMKMLDVVFEFYERDNTAGISGAIDHIAFCVDNIDEMYRIAKENNYSFMQDCAESVQVSTYWPHSAKWFIVYGINGEKIEFSQEL
ncbi:MAG: VOC family protein [Burkholderiales bacterium]